MSRLLKAPRGAVYNKRLAAMLAYRRPAGSKSEAAFIARYIDIVPGMEIDGFGNRMVRLGESNILWSCHTDTVHHRGGRATVFFDAQSRDFLSDGKDCLGADDTAGIWLMLEMIQANIPGLYVFHRAEEIGGQGSQFIADSTPELLAGIDIAIAFDRKGRRDVLTHQMGRCCSDAFAAALATQLGMGYAPCPNGIFTDTANYVDLVAECTNISVGYEGAHSQAESLSEPHLLALRDCILGIHAMGGFAALPVSRDPAAIDLADPWDWQGGRAAPVYTDFHDAILDNIDRVAEILSDQGYEPRDLYADSGLTFDDLDWPTRF